MSHSLKLRERCLVIIAIIIAIKVYKPLLITEWHSAFQNMVPELVKSGGQFVSGPHEVSTELENRCLECFSDIWHCRRASDWYRLVSDSRV